MAVYLFTDGLLGGDNSILPNVLTFSSLSLWSEYPSPMDVIALLKQRGVSVYVFPIGKVNDGSPFTFSPYDDINQITDKVLSAKVLRELIFVYVKLN